MTDERWRHERGSCRRRRRGRRARRFDAGDARRDAGTPRRPAGKREVPRWQIGESLLPSTVHGVCRLTGVADELAKAGFTKKRGGTQRWGANPEPWTFAFSVSPKMTGETSFAYQVERSKFDQILLDHARHMGVDVREHRAVTDVIDDDDRVHGVYLHRRRRQRGQHPRELRGRRLGQQEPNLPAGRGGPAVLGVLPQPRALRLLRGRQAPAGAKRGQHLLLSRSTAAGSGTSRSAPH